MELAKKLRKEIDECDWSMLTSLHATNSVLVIDSKLDLVDVAVAISHDDTLSVSQWQSLGMIRRPTDREVNDWEKDPYLKMAHFLIVQPFVIIQVKTFQ